MVVGESETLPGMRLKAIGDGRSHLEAVGLGEIFLEAGHEAEFEAEDENGNLWRSSVWEQSHLGSDRMLIASRAVGWRQWPSSRSGGRQRWNLSEGRVMLPRSGLKRRQLHHCPSQT